MKNKAKKFVALLLCTGLVASVAALSACGDGRGAILIEGDFSTEATTEQRAEVLEKVSSFSQHDMFEVEGESTSRNVRMYSDGVIGMEMSASQEGMSMNYSMDMDVRADHTITIASEQDVRGSGTMSFAMGMNVQITGAGADSMNENMEMSFSGNTYNDVSYMYIDGSMSVTASGQSATQDGKFKMDFNSIFDQVMGETSDLSMLLPYINGDGAAMFIDEGTTTKLKISFDKNAWLEIYGSALENVAGDISAATEQLLDAMQFNCFDLYFELDADGALLGYGTDIDASVDTTVTVEGVSVQVYLGMDMSSWLVNTDRAAGQLPTDLDSYEDANML